MGSCSFTERVVETHKPWLKWVVVTQKLASVCARSLIRVVLLASASISPVWNLKAFS